MSSDLIHLNVGGQHFSTTRSTLTESQPQSMLAALLNGKHQEAYDEEGRLFIDRNGNLFNEVLSFLRDGPEWRPPEHKEICKRLLHEFKYFNLDTSALERYLSPVAKSYILVLGGIARGAEGLPEKGSDRIACYDSELHSWGTMKPLPTLMGNCTAAVAADSLFVLGERFSADFETELLRWSRSKASWVTCNVSGLGQRCSFSSCTNNDYIYALGGLMGPSTLTDDVKAYNPHLDCWFKQPKLPQPAHKPAVVSHNNILYAFGQPHPYYFVPSKHTCAFLDPRTKSWQQMTHETVPTAVTAYAGAAAAHRDQIYLIGGLDLHTKANTCYDITAGRWRHCAPPTHDVYDHTAVTVDDTICILGGAGLFVPWEATGGRILDSVSTYNPATDTWIESAPLPVPLRGCGAVVLPAGSPAVPTPFANLIM